MEFKRESDHFLNSMTRTKQLQEDLANRPLVMLRMNPDAYRDEHGNHRGCFATRGKNGKLVLSKEQEWASRVNALAERVQWHLENVPSPGLSVEHLFFSKK